MSKRSSLFLSVLGGIVCTSIALAENPPYQTKDQTQADELNTTVSEEKPVEPSSYIYDLQKLIIKSRQNIKRVNEKIKEQAVLKRNQQREERSHQYYEKGLQLSGQGKLEEAREYFEKAIRITEHPEMAHYIKESTRRLRAEESALQKQKAQHLHEIKEDEKTHLQDTETAYQEAVSLYHQKKFRAAKDGFEHVDEMYPDYKATRSYLKIVDEDIITAEALEAKQQQKEMEHQQKEAEIARQKEKQVWHQEIEAKEKERKEQLKRQAEVAYNEAVRLYKDKKYKEAKAKFQEVEWVVPDYRATDRYLKRIDKDIEWQQKQREREHVKALGEQRWQEVVAKQKMEEQKKKLERQQLEDQAEFLYHPAIALFNKKMMDEAWEKFNEVEKIIPNYKSTHSYMALVLKDLPEKAKQLREQEIQETQLLTDLAARSAKLYRQIAELANDKNTVVAKKKLAEVDEVLNNLKQEKERTLKQIQEEEERKQQEEQAKINTLEEQHRREKQAQRQQQLADIAQKAADINDQILKLVKAKDYTGARAKFDELEQTMADLRTVKEAISQKGEKEELAKKNQALKEREVRQQREMMFRQGISLYKDKQYVQAKTIFDQLASQGDHRASSYAQKTDRLIQKNRNGLRQQEQEQRQKEMKRHRQEAEQKEQARLEKQRQAQQEAMQQERQRREHLRQQRVQALQERKAQQQEQWQKEMKRRRQEAEQKEKVRLEKQRQAQQETKHNTELEKVFHKRQQLMAEQQAIRQELVNGVEAMYQEAINLYKAGNYQAAFKRFSYVQRLIPNYKDTDIFLKKFQNFSVPSGGVPHLEKAATAPARTEEISKTLDLFDSKAQ